MASLQLNSKVKLTTLDKQVCGVHACMLRQYALQCQEIHGTVWGADKVDRYVVLHSAGAAPGQTCLHIVNRASLASAVRVQRQENIASANHTHQEGVEVVEPAPQQPLPTLHTLCPQRTAERLEKALKVGSICWATVQPAMCV